MLYPKTSHQSSESSEAPFGTAAFVIGTTPSFGKCTSAPQMERRGWGGVGVGGFKAAGSPQPEARLSFFLFATFRLQLASLQRSTMARPSLSNLMANTTYVEFHVQTCMQHGGNNCLSESIGNPGCAVFSRHKRRVARSTAHADAECR